MPKSIFTAGLPTHPPDPTQPNVNPLDFIVPVYTMKQIGLRDLPHEPKKPQSGSKSQKKSTVPQKRKKSTIVSRYKKKNKLSKSTAKLVPETAIPTELTQQQEAEEKSKKRRYSKFHPRDGEVRVEQKKSASANAQPETHVTAESAARHNAKVRAKFKASTVLRQPESQGNSSHKPLLDNDRRGMQYDVDRICSTVLNISQKLIRNKKKLQAFTPYIPQKENKQQNYNKALDSLTALATQVDNLCSDIRRTLRYLVSKTVFETRHARTVPHSNLTGLAYEPATIRIAEEQTIHLKRTPLVRNHEAQEEEANMLLHRHISTIKSEIAHNLEIISPLQELAASQTEILELYTNLVKRAKLTEPDRISYTKCLESLTKLMTLMSKEAHNKQAVK